MARSRVSSQAIWASVIDPLAPPLTFTVFSVMNWTRSESADGML
ncbi:hypothetical protein [Actinoplanes palleronii]|nr:hypothetical protein [Actinoplanes palleronii]